MAKISSNGSFSFLFNCERSFFGSELNDTLKFRLGCGDEKKKKKLFLESLNGFHGRSVGVNLSGFAKVCSYGNKSSGFKTVEILKRNGGDDGEEEEEEEMGFGEFERDELSCFRGLVLDISYRPVNVVCWKRAICLEFTEKVDVLEYYDQTVSSAQRSFYIPAVLRVPHLLQVVKRRRITHNLSRKSIYFRDSYSCQYCASKQNLTIDHVLPISRGGEWAWDNLVTACSTCNSRKGQKTMEEANMKLLKIPKAPKDFDILAIPLTMAAAKTLKTRKGVPEEWQQYLGPTP